MLHVNPLNAKLNPICHFLALLGAHPIPHVSGIRVNRRVDNCQQLSTCEYLLTYRPHMPSYLGVLAVVVLCYRNINNRRLRCF